MNSLQPERLLFLYAHLLLCVFALQRVLATDWRVLRGTLGAAELERTHRVVVRLLAGLWLTGLTLAAIDLGFDASTLLDRPKLATKFVTVLVLTLNGVVLRAWCFPRLTAGRPLAGAEEALVMCAGALSTASWLAAAFFGIAKPLQHRPLTDGLTVYATIVGGALLAALVLAAAKRRRPPQDRASRLAGPAATWRLDP